jgi:hypothetical protein
METPTPSLRALWRLRLGLGAVVLLGSLTCFVGTSWDIQWHSLIGRDRVLIPPHLMMLGGVALAGVAALTDVLIETIWARRNGLVAERTVVFAGLFSAPLGSYVAGFAALDAAVAFPLDAYWHALYGIDVAIWAPFHVMILGGMAVTALGGAYLLASAGRLAAGQGAVAAGRLGSAGSLAAFAAAFNVLTFLVFDGLGSRGMVAVGALTVNLFPPLATLLSATILVVAVRMVPWPWTATSVALIGLVYVAVVAIFVPPATDLLVQVEHQRFIEPDPGISLVAFQWPLMPVLAAIAVDVVRWGAGRVRTASPLPIALAVCCLLACLPVLPIEPLRGLELVAALGAAGAAASLLLSLACALWGAWLGGQAELAFANAEAAPLMHLLAQRLLLAVGLIALAGLLVEIGLSIAATMHGSQPARVVRVDAGPYPLQVSLYTDPARAGFAVPFAIAPIGQPGGLTFAVTSQPGPGVSATPVSDGLSADQAVPGGVQGAAEVPVQGNWSLAIAVDGPRGPAQAAVPFPAKAPPAIPNWLGWLIGFVPFYVLISFLVVQRPRRTLASVPARA